MSGNRKRTKTGSEYLSMSSKRLRKLPAFDKDGNVVFYKIGKQLYGKEALLRFVAEYKALKFSINFPNP